MATANFRPMLYDMPLVCGGMEDLPEWDAYEEFYDAERLADDFTENLKYHEVIVIGGYYAGFQFYVTEKYENLFDLDRGSEYAIDNADARYYFDLCRSRVLRDAEAEKRRIARWLNNLQGYEHLKIHGRFSNGETLYVRA